MKTVHVSRTINVPADTLWDHLICYDTFAEVEPGGIDLSRFRGRIMREGDDISVPLRIGPFPAGTWTIDVLRVDPDNRVIKTEECGGPVKRVARTMVATWLAEDYCRYDDHVVIDAGMLSGLVAARVRRACQARQERLAALLENA
ncbi:SRPBCC family protein [Parvularcula lutaonensis]|uniref:SRPBCC family protein n=1 Tax=Parvularcula lutaonensis TaxID=491923 RepID=A0ABV7MAC4_9PROT|nr:SRPBCC family protein [Parvularcula lutaonensis]GGY44156.1 hypothetical protein GCM10007148_11320 [Parvularcula lutaonensis]